MNGGELTGIKAAWYRSAWMPRVAPFAIFMAFIGVQELLEFFAGCGTIPTCDSLPMDLYPVKALAAGAALLFYASSYSELRLGDLSKVPHSIVSICTGLFVFVLWINLDFHFGAEPKAFDPTLLKSGLAVWATIGFRLLGSALIVPVMEELFWRSFLIRYLVNKDFAAVPAGLFTWPSFLICSVLFGLEHHLILAGIVAGAAYNLLFYHTKSVTQCILSHAITNLALGVYVVCAGQWGFW
jgi:CAAX prenyl protease-like protein